MLRHLTTKFLQLRLNNVQLASYSVVTKSSKELAQQNIITVQKPAHQWQPFARGLVTNNDHKQEDTSNVNSQGAQHSDEQKPGKQHNPFARRLVTDNGQKNEGTPDENNQGVQHNEEDERRLKILKLEVDIANQEGRNVPSLGYLKQHHWDHILTLPSKSARFKYYGFLWQVEMKKASRQLKKQKKAESGEEKKNKVLQERAENPHIVYGLGHVSMFLRIYDAAITQWMNHRLVRAMQFSPKIVLDCSYDDHMTKREAENAAKQLMLCFAENRANDDPFDLHYCNVKLESTCMKSLHRYIPTMLNPDFPMNVHQKCYSDIFPKENLVYLTPHCRTELKEYNPDDVYIIGAMVDTVNNEPLSLAKAKKQGLRVARLPLDRYLQWSSGSGKSLTLNQMVNILLDLKKTGDWMTALSHVPRRKIVDAVQKPDDFRKKLLRQSNRINVRIDKLFENDTKDAPKRKKRIL